MKHGEYLPIEHTPSDLLAERDQLPWFFRVTTTVLSWMALGGYVLFAIIFASAEDNLRSSKLALTLVASLFLALSYGGATAAAVTSRSLLFTYDAILLPFFSSSVMGVFIIVMNHALHRHFPPSSDPYIYFPLVTAASTTVAFGGLVLIVCGRLEKIKRANRRRQQQQQQQQQKQYSRRDNKQSSSTTELMPVVMPEDEAQRQQLLRLLLQRESERTASPEGAESTYRIDLPEEEPVGGGQSLKVPPNSRMRSGSLPSITNTWRLSNLLGRRSQHSPPAEAVADSREQRRQEIERQSMTFAPSPSPNLDQGGWPLPPPTPPTPTTQYQYR